jgi:fluoride ion exporter CrcB/FEX
MLLVQDGQWLSAVGNVTSSVVLCLLATGLGISLANALPWGT